MARQWDQKTTRSRFLRDEVGRYLSMSNVPPCLPRPVHRRILAFWLALVLLMPGMEHDTDR